MGIRKRLKGIKMKRLSTNEIIDNFKKYLNLRFDVELSKLLDIKPNTITSCRIRESSTILFPIMDYLVDNNIDIKSIFYK